MARPASRVIVPGGVECLNDGYQHGCVLDLRGNLHLLLDPSNVEFVNQSLGIILVLTFTIKRTLRNTDFLVNEKMISPPEGGVSLPFLQVTRASSWSVFVQSVGTSMWEKMIVTQAPLRK